MLKAFPPALTPDLGLSCHEWRAAALDWVGHKGCCFLGSLPGVFFGRCPDGKAECNLVHEVGKVVDQVQCAVSNTAHEVAEEVAKRIDGPAHRDDEAHGGEGSPHVLAHTSSSNLACLTCKDLEQDEAPASHAQSEAHPRINSPGLTCIAEGKHSNCAQQQTPEHALGQVRLHCRENQVELNHLQRNCDRPIPM